MGERRFSDSSIFIKDLGRVYDEALKSSSEICLYDHPAIQELKKSKTARFRVYLTRLEPRITVYRDEKMTDPMAVSKDLVENTISSSEAGVEPQLSEAFLFDASGVGQLMCLGVGRYAHNLLRPYMGSDVDAYYRAPEDHDPGSLCGQISRDHGLVFLDDEARIYYRDFGTKKDGHRAGSKNGTWINGEERIRDLVIPWHEGDYLGIGGRAWVKRDGVLAKEHVFKLRYERVPEKPAEKSPSDTRAE